VLNLSLEVQGIAEKIWALKCRLSQRKFDES